MSTNESQPFQQQEKDEILSLLRRIVSEDTGNRQEDIRPESLIYDELNLTEYDLQLIVKQIASQLEIDGDGMSEAIIGNEDIVRVADVVDLIMDEKELG